VSRQLLVYTTEGARAPVSVLPGLTTVGQLRAMVAHTTRSNPDQVGCERCGVHMCQGVWQSVQHALFETSHSCSNGILWPLAGAVVMPQCCVLAQRLHVLLPACACASPLQVRLSYAGKELPPSADDSLLALKPGIDVVAALQRFQGGGAASA
jgi:hypothetical protein